MTALKYIDRLERLHLLIRRKSTGSPKELARRLFMSETTVYECIRTLKALGAPITYNLYRQTYEYDKPCSLSLRYEVEDLGKDELAYAQAGQQSMSRCFLIAS